ncbi:MAG: tRNA (adenosine(37)-N6)-threonylcarbamoyltransferase complex transferase subunit TsaD [Nitrososphaerota archaeon]|nr:tRNA (adenosine(37)-N6)-threonylcarbamoyltransferase complex transferase subunit TsaD [Nitrososphaerota archaeon]
MNRLVLGVESTAHTFSASVVSTDGKILSNAKSVYKAPEGSGIHPFEASQNHLAAAPSVLEEAIRSSGAGLGEISAVAYAMGPGLGPCLRVGAVAARTLAASLGVPLVPVNHAVGHIELGCLLTGARDPVVLLVSGGHTMIIAFSGGRWRILGESLDLTLGQLLDQLGRHHGLASPCGRAIEEAASRSSSYLRLPYSVKGNDVSFSGLLTASKTLLDRGASFEDVSYSLQETSFSMVTEVTERALAFTEKKEVMIVGGVAANRRLSQMMSAMAGRHSARVLAVPLEYSGDCGAQIAWTGALAHGCGIQVPVVESSVRQSWRLDVVDIPWRS